MKNLALIAAVLIATPAAADDLVDAFNICQQHRTVYSKKMDASEAMAQMQNPHPVWQEGWEHCDAIVTEYEKTDAGRQAKAEANDPQLKKTRDMARKLRAGQ